MLPSKFTITSSAFKEGEMILKKYTGEGENISPPLAWVNPPEGTRSFALLNDDPDTPIGTIIHWLVKDISASCKEIKENTVPGVELAKKIEKRNILVLIPQVELTDISLNFMLWKLKKWKLYQQKNLQRKLKLLK